MSSGTDTLSIQGSKSHCRKLRFCFQFWFAVSAGSSSMPGSLSTRVLQHFLLLPCRAPALHISQQYPQASTCPRYFFTLNVFVGIPFTLDGFVAECLRRHITLWITFSGIPESRFSTSFASMAPQWLLCHQQAWCARPNTVRTEALSTSQGVFLGYSTSVCCFRWPLSFLLLLHSKPLLLQSPNLHIKRFYSNYHVVSLSWLDPTWYKLPTSWLLKGFRMVLLYRAKLSLGIDVGLELFVWKIIQ